MARATPRGPAAHPRHVDRRDRTSRAGEAAAARARPGPAAPMTMAAVLAMLASTHDAAATVTVRQHGRGRARRCGVDDVVELDLAASPAAHGRCPRWPGRRAVDGDGLARVVVVDGVVVGHQDRPAVGPGRAGHGQVAADADQHRRAAGPAARPRRPGRRPGPWPWPRGRARPRPGRRTVRPPRSSAHRPPARAAACRRMSQRPARRAARTGSRGRSRARAAMRPPWGRRSPSVTAAARTAVSMASNSRGDTGTGRPAGRVQRRSARSRRRKREQAASIASISAAPRRRRRRARRACGGQHRGVGPQRPEPGDATGHDAPDDTWAWRERRTAGPAPAGSAARAHRRPSRRVAAVGVGRVTGRGWWPGSARPARHPGVVAPAGRRGRGALERAWGWASSATKAPLTTSAPAGQPTGEPVDPGQASAAVSSCVHAAIVGGRAGEPSAGPAKTR